MYFDQKLKYLMHLFKVSNSKLARGINVDASLVSRWKSGERVMSANSPHIPAVATYFLHLNTYQYQKEALDHILTMQNQVAEIRDEDQRVLALSDWLVSSEPLYTAVISEKPESPVTTGNLIANIADLISASPASSVDNQQSSSEIPVMPVVKPGLARTVEVFEGIDGRRQAVANFLLQVLQADQKLDLLLISEDDIGWLFGDSQYARFWSHAFGQIVQKGHHITIIHVVNRKSTDIFKALTYWMPMHLAGSIDAYYFPRYILTSVRQTLFIARGLLSVSAWTTGNEEKELTYIHRDQDTLKQFTTIFETHLAQCKPLFSVYTGASLMNLMAMTSQFRHQFGSIFTIRNTLNSLCLKPDKLMQYLDIAPNKGIPANTMHQYYAEHQQSFFEQLKTEHQYDLLPVGVLEDILENGGACLESSMLNQQQPIRLSTAETICWLQSTIDLLKNYPNYHLYFNNNTFSPDHVKINIIYQEDTGALFSSSNRNHGIPVALMLNEANILRSMSYYFESVIDQIPSAQRNTPDVINRLERVIEQLKIINKPQQTSVGCI